MLNVGPKDPYVPSGCGRRIGFRTGDHASASRASWQRCVMHFYRNVFTATPIGKVREVAAMLKAIHAQRI